MKEVYSMSEADVEMLIKVASDRLEGHQYEDAETLYRRAWFANLVAPSNSKKSPKSCKNKALLGLARTYLLRSRTRMTLKDAANMLRSLTLFQYSERGGTATPERRRLEKSLKSLITRELSSKPNWLNKLFEQRSSTRFQDDRRRAIPIKVPLPSSDSSDDNETISSVTLDKMRDSIHGLVRQLSMETRKASNRKMLPEKMLRESVSSSLISLQCRDDMPDELQCFSERKHPLKCKLKRHSSDTSYYNKRKVTIRRQHSFDYSPNNLPDTLRRSDTLPVYSRTPRVSTEDDVKVSSAKDLSEQILETWTRVKVLAMPNGVSSCKPEITVCQRSSVDFLDNIIVYENLTLTNLLLDIHEDPICTTPGGSELKISNNDDIINALVFSLNTFADNQVCECASTPLLLLVRALSSACTDYHVGEVLLADHDVMMTSLAANRMRSFNDEFACVSWFEFARSRLRHAHLSTIQELHDQIRRNVDTSLPVREERTQYTRIAGYLKKAYGYAVSKQKPDVAAFLGDCILVNGDVVEAAEYLEEASECENLVVRASALSRLASCLFMQTKYIRSQRLYETAHSLFQNSIDKHEEEVAFVRTMIAQCLHETGSHRNTILWSLRGLHGYDQLTSVREYADMPDFRRWFIVRCLFISGFTYCYIEFYDKSLNMLEHCYNTIVEGTDDMHTMLLLRTMGDVMSSKSTTDEETEEQNNNTAKIYGHSLRFAKTDTDKFQIHDRLAALKVNASDFKGAGEDLDAALKSQLNLQRGIESSLARTLDLLAGNFAIAGDLEMAADCASESLAAVKQVEEDTSGRHQRAKTLRRLARLSRTDTRRSNDYFSQAAEIDPVSRVHYASFLHKTGRYHDALLTLLPYITKSTYDDDKEHFDTEYLPVEVKYLIKSSADTESVCLHASTYALYLAADSYRHVNFADEYHRCLSELKQNADKLDLTTELKLVAAVALKTSDFRTAAGYFRKASKSESDNHMYNYWICVCLDILQRFTVVSRYVMTTPIIEHVQLHIQLINDKEREDNSSSIASNCSSIIEEDIPEDESQQDISTDIYNNREIFSNSLNISKSDDINELSDNIAAEYSENRLTPTSYDENSDEIQGISTDSSISNFTINSTSIESLNLSSDEQSSTNRKAPNTLDLNTNDTWQYEVEETITTPQVILEALRKLNSDKCDDLLNPCNQAKISVNSEISNFDCQDDIEEYNDEVVNEEEDDEDVNVKDDEEEEEIFQTWEEYTEYSDGANLLHLLEQSKTTPVIENKEKVNQEDKGYNSDNEWTTTEEIVDTPYVIMQALQRNNSMG